MPSDLSTSDGGYALKLSREKPYWFPIRRNWKLAAAAGPILLVGMFFIEGLLSESPWETLALIALFTGGSTPLWRKHLVSATEAVLVEIGPEGFFAERARRAPVHIEWDDLVSVDETEHTLEVEGNAGTRITVVSKRFDNSAYRDFIGELDVLLLAMGFRRELVDCGARTSWRPRTPQAERALP